PIHKRVSTQEIETALNKRLREQDIQTPFEYAVYSNNVVTKVHSENFNLDPSSTYPIPLFANENSRRNYEFFVNFPKKDPEVINTILGMILLSLIFMAVIILAYSTALRQLLRQQQISQIKTDFINNMTHEFKTPIATINLALDAIKNPIVVGNEAFLKRYHGMIREENKRMLVQVENMLRISKLEKNELDLTKVRIQLHDVIEVAITHLQLIVENRKGYIKTYFNAVECTILGNESHLTNVIVNMLDNAVKYSEGTPKIDVYTENVKDFIVLKIRDQGLGMTKQVQKKIFEKFYREHTGNVHNVKGHGLGLAYVKWILKDHGAEISVQSEKGKGSTFIIKTRLIA
ncbi:MAG: sensor histidine kinase, partial [Marinirhabdus sp.]